MNGIDRIIDRITEDILAEIEAENDRARREKETLDAESDKAVKARTDAILEAGRREALEQRRRLNRVSELEAKKELLAAKQEMIDRAFALAARRLHELEERDCIALLSKMAASVSQRGDEELILSPRDRAAVGERVVESANRLLAGAGKNAALRLSEEESDIDGGLIVKSGRVDVNCSFETLLRLSRERLTGRVAEILFN